MYSLYSARGQPNFLDAVIGEGRNAVVIVEAVNPDDAILGFRAEGEVVDEFFIDAGLTPSRPPPLHAPRRIIKPLRAPGVLRGVHVLPVAMSRDKA